MIPEMRLVSEEDRPFLLALYRSVRAAEMADWGWSEQQLQQFAAMQYTARCRHYDAVYPDRKDSIILLDGAAVGLLSIAHGESEVTLVDIAVLPEFQGHGIGRGLLTELQREAAESMKPLRLHVLNVNRPAALFYQRLGFARIADDGVYRQLEWRPATSSETTSLGEISWPKQ